MLCDNHFPSCFCSPFIFFVDFLSVCLHFAKVCFSWMSFHFRFPWTFPKRWKNLWRVVGDWIQDPSGMPYDISCCGSVCLKEQTVNVDNFDKKAPVKHYSCFWLKLLSNLKQVCMRVWVWERMFFQHQAEHFLFFFFLNYWLYSFKASVWREQLFHNKTIECSRRKVSADYCSVTFLFCGI